MFSDMQRYADLVRIINGSKLLIQCLHGAAEINLPNWWLVGGVIRDVVWSELTKRDANPEVRDIDLIYYNPKLNSESTDRNLEAYLGSVSGIKWSVKNQARMHSFEGLPQYQNIEEAISYFPETISGIVIKSTPYGEPLMLNMYGLTDLFEMKLRPTPNYLRLHSFEHFKKRVHKKKWLEKWPEAEIVI